jgi:TATA-box binding protein (TBP) (component of TFIID and TFIIIB)
VIKSRQNSPYINGKPYYTAQRPGTYLIYRSGRLVYVGFSSYNVYKTLYRHFQSWNDPQQVRIVYDKNDPNIKVRVIYTTAARARKLEKAIIIKYQPKDNPDKYENYLDLNRKESKVIEEAENEFTANNDDLPF